MQIGVLQSPPRLEQAAKQAATPAASLAAFVPPWYGQQNPDAVTGATPKVMSFNWAIGIVSPSVAGINAAGAIPQSASGIIVHRRGYILTNNHVVNEAKNIVVTLSSDKLVKSYPAKIVDSRPDIDLAVIKINPTGRDVLTPVPLGDSDRIYIGQQVVAIGNPFGLTQSASSGIISNAQRTLSTGNKVFDGLIQTDASINPGSSGGALVNAKAEVIGINTAIYSPTQAFSGIGFAVPINHAKKAFPDFIEIVRSPLSGPNARMPGGNMNRVNFPPPGDINLQMMAAKQGARRCWLGIGAHTVNNVVSKKFNLPTHHGVLVNRIFPNSPATRIGLMKGDVIYRADRKRVKDEKMLWSILAGKKAGDTVTITLFRNNTRQTFDAILEPEPPSIRAVPSKKSPALQADPSVPTGTLPSPRQQNAAGKKFIEGHWLGLEVIPLTAELATEYQVPKGQTGVLVDEVTLEAAESGILAGDMVQSINGFPAPDLKTFFQATQRVQEKERAPVGISRRGNKMTFMMEAQNTNMLGFAQMEAAQPIQPGALRPHRYMGSCASCHVFMKTGGQLPTDAGDILPDPPPIAKNATAPHRYRGRCVNCHATK
jgi:serine protease Do